VQPNSVAEALADAAQGVHGICAPVQVCRQQVLVWSRHVDGMLGATLGVGQSAIGAEKQHYGAVNARMTEYRTSRKRGRTE
jgi:hypothetical protein